MSDITDVFDLIKIGPRAHLSSFVIYTRASEPYSVHGSEYTRDAVPLDPRAFLSSFVINTRVSELCSVHGSEYTRGAVPCGPRAHVSNCLPGLRSYVQLMTLNRFLL